MTAPGWMSSAKCRGISSWEYLDEAHQKAECRDCLVRLECLEYGLKPSPYHVRYSVVYGGLTGDQLVEIARTRRGMRVAS